MHASYNPRIVVIANALIEADDIKGRISWISEDVRLSDKNGGDLLVPFEALDQLLAIIDMCIRFARPEEDIKDDEDMEDDDI